MKAGARYLAWTTVAALFLGGSPFLANAADSPPPSEDIASKTQALDLFRQGRAALEAKDYAAAVADFEQSFRLDPGGGTELNLALAYELSGKTATAWTAFHKALRMARLDGRADRVKEAEANIAELEGRLSRLRVVVPQPARVLGLTVLRDGIALDEASWGEAIPADPGEHRIQASAPGKKPWRAVVSLGDNAEQKDLTVEVLADDLSRPFPPGTVSASAPDVTRIPPATPRDDTTWHRAAGYAALGAAAVFAGAGIVAWRVYEDNAAIINDDSRCLTGPGTRGAQCAGQYQAADLALGIEIGTFAVAAAAAVAGTWLLLTPGSKPARTVVASCSPRVGLAAGLAVQCRVPF